MGAIEFSDFKSPNLQESKLRTSYHCETFQDRFEYYGTLSTRSAKSKEGAGRPITIYILNESTTELAQFLVRLTVKLKREG